jgi:aspartate/methionine/tyrosine aminotransferase
MTRAPATAETTASSFEHLLGRPGVAWMGQNTTHLEPPPEVVEALAQSIRTREFQLYAPPLGFTELRELIVADLGLPGAQAWVTDGAVGGLHHICTALAPGISRVITTDPGWPWPARFAALAGVPVTSLSVYAPEQGYAVTARQVADVIEPGSLLYLVDPLNPLGSRCPRAELTEIVALARATRSLIVHDCTYRHFADGHTLAAALYPEGTLTTYSFSKWLGLAGLRLGAVVAVPELLSRLTAVPSNPLGANISAQRAAVAGLRVGQPWLTRLRAATRGNQEIVARAVAESGLGMVLVQPSQGNFLAVDVAESGHDSEEVCTAMLEHDIVIRPGTYQSPRFGTRFVKVSTSVPTEWAERFAVAWKLLRPDGVLR